MDVSTHIYDEASALSVNKYTLKGWIFIGWNSQADGSGDSYSDKAVVTGYVKNGIGKLYAQWKQKNYKLNYYGNRPNNATSKLEGNMVFETHFYEDEYNLKKIAYILEGWTFKGWNTEADGSGLSYKDEQIVRNLTETGFINLYAQWEVSTYTVVYDKNKPTNTDFEVEGVMNDSTHIYDNSSFLRTNAYTLEGWHFLGWNTEADGSGTPYTNGAEVTTLVSNGSIRLYAQWQANTYTIQYKPNRPNSSNLVVGETMDSTHNVDSYSILSTNGYSLKGWTFKGWNTKADGSGTSYSNKENVKNVTTNASNIELYAQWEVKNLISNISQMTQSLQQIQCKEI